jgi:RNA polymerase sigma-70 factor (ECF subfamily)
MQAIATHPAPRVLRRARRGPACEAPRERDGEFRTATAVSTGDDEALVARAQAGDRAAFEELVRRHADGLHAVVRRLTRDAHEADEVTQEAFLRAWRGIGGFQGDAQFFTWLYRIGVNEARRRAARSPAARGEVALADPGADAPDPAPGPPARAEQADLRAALERAVRDLEPDQRAPLILRDIEGLSTAEAAAILGLREAAFKSRLHRARMRVRAAVEADLMTAEERA